MTVVLRALPSLAAALVGAGLAALWLEASWLWAVVLVVIPIGIGLLVRGIGRRKLAQNDPVGALWGLEVSLLVVPLALTAVLVAVGIVIGVELEPDDKASVESKKLLAAIVAAFGAFLSAVLISSAEDVDGKWLAPRIRDAFQGALRKELRDKRPPNAPATDGELALESPNWHRQDWGWSGRRERARAIREALALKSASVAPEEPSLPDDAGG